MKLFLSTYHNSLDKKSRLSIPASFRTILGEQIDSGIIVYPSIKNRSIEACGIGRLEELNNFIKALDSYSVERDAFETVILGGSTQLNFDNEGRVVLPKELVDYANITTEVKIIGKGQVFEIWNPQALAEHCRQAQKIAFENRSLIKYIGLPIVK